MATRLFLSGAVLVLAGAGPAPAQPPAPAAQREAMKRLDFLLGRWEGEGWMEFVPGQRRPFHGAETVQPKAGGTVVTLEGLHRGRSGGAGPERVVHEAFGLVWYDEKAKRYRFQAHTARGDREETEAKVADGQLAWGMTVPRFGEVRYTIRLDDQGRWFETGEVSADGKSRKFFEMTLRRVDPK